MDASELRHLSTPALLKRVIGAKLKELFFPRTIGTWPGVFVGLPGTDYNYAAALGDGLACSVITPVAQWIMRAFPEAPLVVRERKADSLEIVADHPLVRLVDRPNAFYPGTVLWMATIADWVWFGESYWRILSTRGGQPGELWWLPPWSVEPQWPSDGSEWISHYEYHPDGRSIIRLELEEVIHFRHGMDPRQPRHGLPPLRAMIREIWSDNEASNWTGALLRNMGIPGLILSPKGDAGGVSEAEVDRVKAYVRGRFVGDQRGEPMVLGGPTQVDRLTWAPKEMDLNVVRMTAEERVSAALGIPAAVVGFHAGLENSKVGATMHEFVQLAWNNGIIPMQRLLAGELQSSLLPLFELDPDRLVVGWDYDEVQALEKDENALAERLDRMVKGGWLKVSEARHAMGYESTPEDEIYLRSPLLQPVDPADQMPEPEPLALPPPAGGPPGVGRVANGNGNGQPVQQRAYRLKQGTLEELVQGIVGREAGRMNNPPQALRRAATRLYREEKRLQPQFQAMILSVLERYGHMAAIAASEILLPQKQELEDILRTSIIHERMPLVSVRAELGEVYAAMYAMMAERTLKILQDDLDFTPTDTARIEAQLSMAARERVALLDLSTEARTSILKSLEEARQQGLDESQMVELIRHRVPSGRWSSPEMRAQILARSESRYASNIATVGLARDVGASKVLILDARLGPTDPECTIRNGWVVSPSQAQALAGIEHANGTLALLPLASSMAEGVGATS